METSDFVSFMTLMNFLNFFPNNPNLKLKLPNFSIFLRVLFDQALTLQLLQSFERFKRLNFDKLCEFLEFCRTPYVQERVNIGSGPPGSKVRWFRSESNEERCINTVSFDSKEGSPTLVMIHGYGASQGFFFRNFDALASRFRVIAIDQLG